MGLPPRERIPRRRKGVKVEVGDWFAVPLDGGGFCIGRAMSVDNAEEELIAYFFGPRRRAIPDVLELGELLPADAISAHWVSMYGLTRFDWHILGKGAVTNVPVWPMPIFWGIDFMSLQPRLEIPQYGGPVDSRSYVKVPCDIDDTNGKPLAGLVSHWGVVEVLSKLLPWT